jgi:hypothetical protein
MGKRLKKRLNFSSEINSRIRMPDRVNWATLIMNFDTGIEMTISTRPQKYMCERSSFDDISLFTIPITVFFLFNNTYLI